MGEIEAAELNALPHLLEERDLCGLLHIHTHFSDGSHSLEEIAHLALERGYAYVGIADHSQSAYYAGGMKREEIERQCQLIDTLNVQLAPFRIFKGIEADILPDGRLDYEDEVLAQFDFVIAAVHSNFHLPREEMTQRILTALRHPYTTILAHPTGRLLLSRDPYEVDIAAIIDEAAVQGKVIELNCNPSRLDLSWVHCIHAKKRGVKIAINPDIHDTSGFDHVALGVKMARKGWLEKSDCLNCLTALEMNEFFTHLRLSQNSGLPPSSKMT